MDKLEEMLEKEATLYRPQAALLRFFASHIRGLDKYTIDDLEIKIHLDNCKEYFDLFKTIEGKNSPWMLKGEK